LQGAEIREAKEILAVEATKIVHGEEEAKKARNASRALFSKEKTDEDAIPTKFIEKEKFTEGIPIFKLFETTSLCASGSEARRLIEQGGGYVNDKRVDKYDLLIKLDDFNDNDEILLRAGKKKFYRIKMS
jgi:tyrosyl-tRNA synthetase